MTAEIAVPSMAVPPKAEVNWLATPPTVLSIVDVVELHIKSAVGVTQEVIMDCWATVSDCCKAVIDVWFSC